MTHPILTTEEVLARLLPMFEEHLTGAGEIAVDTNFTQIGLDSLDIAELMMEVEEEFDIVIPDVESDSMQTIGDFAKFILKRKLTADESQSSQT